MKWLKKNHRELTSRLRDYFGKEYFGDYGLNDSDSDEFIHTDDYLEFFQESSTDDSEQLVFDDNELLPF